MVEVSWWGASWVRVVNKFIDVYHEDALLQGGNASNVAWTKHGYGWLLSVSTVASCQRGGYTWGHRAAPNNRSPCENDDAQEGSHVQTITRTDRPEGLALSGVAQAFPNKFV